MARTGFTEIVDMPGKTAAFDKSPFFGYHLPDLTPGSFRQATASMG
ncbi:MAG: hypothetical protein ACF8OB_00540 [Phycisphaeraceae bacterium JB051]